MDKNKRRRPSFAWIIPASIIFVLAFRYLPGVFSNQTKTTEESLSFSAPAYSTYGGVLDQLRTELVLPSDRYQEYINSMRSSDALQPGLVGIFVDLKELSFESTTISSWGQECNFINRQNYRIKEDVLVVLAYATTDDEAFLKYCEDQLQQPTVIKIMAGQNDGGFRITYQEVKYQIKVKINN